MVTSVESIRKEEYAYGALMIFDEDGRHEATRFRMWSPSHIPVLHLPESNNYYQMEDCGSAIGEKGRAGWAELILPAALAPVGAQYLFGFPNKENESELKYISDFDPFGLKGDFYSPSVVTDLRFDWTDQDWKGIPQHKLRKLLLHVATDTKEGNFLSLIPQLPDFASRGYNCLELINFGASPASTTWGFDGVYPNVPQPSYGTLHDLMTLINAAHKAGIAVCIQLIQNHLGGVGNNISLYAKEFYLEDEGEWGTKIDYTNPDVRLFFKQATSLYADACHADMLRFDAVHAIDDPSPVHLLDDLQKNVYSIAQKTGRTILISHENQMDSGFIHLGKAGDKNVRAQVAWADSISNAAKCVFGGTDMDVGYYRHFFREPGADVDTTEPSQIIAVKALAEAVYYGGYNVQYGDPNRKEGIEEAKDHIVYNPTHAEIHADNHDQAGNTVDGISPFEKLMLADKKNGLQRMKSFLAFVILQPSIPMIWNHFGRNAPFPFFLGHDEKDIVKGTFEGRQEELIKAGYDEQDVKENMLRPEMRETFEEARLYDPQGNDKHPIPPELDDFIKWAFFYREKYIEPLLEGVEEFQYPEIEYLGDYEGLSFTWNLNDVEYALAVNPSGTPLLCPKLGMIDPYGFRVPPETDRLKLLPELGQTLNSQNNSYEVLRL